LVATTLTRSSGPHVYTTCARAQPHAACGAPERHVRVTQGGGGGRGPPRPPQRGRATWRCGVDTCGRQLQCTLLSP
jgi:hypothetical protein